MKLAQLQSRFAAASMTPLTRSGRMARGPVTRRATELIKPNSRMSSRERLEVYARSYWFRVLDSFRDDFPGLARILGPLRFERLARSYLSERPSRSFTLRDLGSRLPEWIEKRRCYGRLALDMARLEWAHVGAFDGLEKRPLTVDEAAALKPASQVVLQPHITLLEAKYPVDQMRLKPRLRARPQTVFLAVHRVELNVHYRRMDEQEFRLLAALRHGATIGEAIRGVEPESLRLWFSAWARLGWLTRK